jgi:MoaA/NifB/PqqE/SkfB family radical SAM enzyme
MIAHRKPQLMDFGLYKKIIDSLCDMPEPIKTLRLYKDGEPLLNPKFPEMVAYAKATGRFGQIDTTTNGSLLRPTLNKRIIDSGIDKIFISVPQDYSPAYFKNVEHLYELGRKDKCQIYAKMVGDGLPENRKAKFMNDFGYISDRVFLEHIAPCWPGYNVENVNQEKGIYDQPLTHVNVCPYLFYSLSINSDGTVSMCFLDWEHKRILGDMDGQSFESIWNGEILRALRLSHLSGKRNELRMCCDCGQLTHGAPDNIDEYADEIARRL